MRLLSVVLILVFMVLSLTDCAKILGVFHMASYSHFQLGDKIFKTLASRGHDVTVISPFTPQKEIKNMKYVITTGEIERLEKIKANHDFFTSQENNIFSILIIASMMGKMFTENTLNHSNVQEFLKTDQTFDMIIMDEFMNNAFAGFCHHFKAHCVFLCTNGPGKWANSKMGNPDSPSYIPDTYLAYPTKMSFYQRTVNTITYLAGSLISTFISFPVQNQLLHTYFPDAPHLSEMYHNASLMLLNSHVSTNAPVPLVPNMIEIGGYHVNPPKALPKDLQDFLDNAKEGAIYFSLGSTLHSKDMAVEKRDAILKAFSKLNYQILWKWEDDKLPGQPPNVKLAKWLPQQDILAHPNIKLFITHGGLLSTIETVYHGKPVVGIPVYGDQNANMENAELNGYGIRVPYRELTEETLTSALNEILNNPKYAENAKIRSRVMHDQPMKPIDKAMFWIEYVLRHNGAPHLRTAAISLNWYQYLLLDVIALIVVVSYICLCITFRIFKCIFCKKCKRSVPETKKTD